MEDKEERDVRGRRSREERRAGREERAVASCSSGGCSGRGTAAAARAVEEGGGAVEVLAPREARVEVREEEQHVLRAVERLRQRPAHARRRGPARARAARAEDLRRDRRGLARHRRDDKDVEERLAHKAHGRGGRGRHAHGGARARAAPLLRRQPPRPHVDPHELHQRVHHKHAARAQNRDVHRRQRVPFRVPPDAAAAEIARVVHSQQEQLKNDGKI